MSRSRLEDQTSAGRGQRHPLNESSTSIEQPEELDPVELITKIHQLEEENQRLRREYSKINRSQYRQTAIGLAAVGIGTFIAGWLLPASRSVLFAFGSTAMLGVVLLYFLTPERFIPARVGELVYESLAENQTELISDLGLKNSQIYIPIPSSSVNSTKSNIRLFIPQRENPDLPDGDSLDSIFVITNDENGRGVSLKPSADGLVSEFEITLPSGFGDSPTELALQLADGLVEEFDLADEINIEVDEEKGQTTFAISGSAYGTVHRFDDPLQSFLGAGLARGLATPINVEVHEGDRDRVDAIVKCSWRSLSTNNSDIL